VSSEGSGEAGVVAEEGLLEEVNGLLEGLGIAASTRTRGRMASNLSPRAPQPKGQVLPGTVI
jgi:hypothetical protein